MEDLVVAKDVRDGVGALAGVDQSAQGVDDAATYVQRVEAGAPFWAAVQIDVAADGAITLGELQLLDAAPFDN